MTYICQGCVVSWDQLLKNQYGGYVSDSRIWSTPRMRISDFSIIATHYFRFKEVREKKDNISHRIESKEYE